MKLMNQNDNLFGPYEIIEILGKGTYGKVYKCLNINNDEIVAVKTS